MTDPNSRTSGATSTLWLDTSSRRSYPRLECDLSVDVCIVGAGITGLTTAYRLLKDGQSVVVLENGDVGSGETGRTSAHLSNALDDRYHALEKLHGLDGARAAADSHTSAIQTVEDIVRAENIDCEFKRVDGYLFATSDEDVEMLIQERDAALRAGLSGVELVSRAPWAHFNTGRALRFPAQARFHPLKYVSHLADSVARRGGRIFCGTHVASVEDGEPAVATTSDGKTVRAKAIVVATNVPFNDRVVIHTKQAAYRSFVIGARVSADVAEDALYWDTLDPYHYVRMETVADNDRERILIVGGEDHKTGQASPGAAPYENLLRWTRERFPGAAMAYQWSGQVVEPMDGMAFIGRNPGERNVYIVTGDSGNGLTHGTVAALLLTDLIAGRENPWATLYDPSRKTLRSIKEFLHENMNVAPQYLDWLKIRDSLAVTTIAPGSGKVVADGRDKVAVYRDEQGAVHSCSAVCPHLGCLVRWNSNEKSWDCPCHGSRFDPLGKVLNGPAHSDLAPTKTTATVEDR